jgi:hypothetical protein
MPNRDTSKQWFQSGDKPTQGQFYQLLDFLRFKDEAIAMADVNNLNSTLAGKASQAAFDDHVMGEFIAASGDVAYNQLANYLIEKIIIIPGADCNIRIGTTNGGEEILNDVAVVQADTMTHTQVINAFAVADRTIYINGIPAGTKLIVLKRLLKTA